MDIQMSNADATNAAISALLNATTPLEWAVALMALWLACRSEEEFRTELIDHIDEGDAVLDALIEEMRQGSMNRVLQLMK